MQNVPYYFSMLHAVGRHPDTTCIRLEETMVFFMRLAAIIVLLYNVHAGASFFNGPFQSHETIALKKETDKI
jgi:hypothetical protein